MVSALKSAIKYIVITYLVYLIFTLLVATPLLNALAPAIYRAQTGRELRVDNIIVNPFKLSVTLQHAASDNPDGSPFWSFDTLFADVSLSSLWRGYPVLDELRLLNLSLDIKQTAPDRYNFTDILEHRAAREDKPQPPPQATESKPLRIALGKLIFSATHLDFHAPYLQTPLPLEASINGLGINMSDLSTVPSDKEKDVAPDNTLPTLRIGAFSFDLGRFDFKSLRKEQPFSTHLEALRLALKNFSTVARPGQPYTLDVEDEGGGELHWSGDVSVAAGTSSGEVLLRNISLLPAWRFFAPQLAFDASSGMLDASGRYEASWLESVRYRIENGRVAIRNLQTQARNDQDSALNFTQFSVDGIRLDGARREFAARQVLLDGLDMRGWNKDTQVSLADMFKLPPSDSPEEPGPPWQAEIADITVRNSKVGWRASQLDTQLAITPLELHVSDLHYPATTPAKLDLKTTLNETIKLDVNGELNPGNLTGKLSGEIKGLPLAWGNSLLGEYLTAALNNGTLDSQWQVQLDQGAPTTIQADGRVSRFDLQRLPDRRRMLAWKALEWQQLNLDMHNQRVSIKDVQIDEAWAQFRINADGTNNFQKLLITKAGPSASPENEANEAKEQAPAPAKKTSRGKAGKAGKPAAPAAEQPSWQVAVNTIHPRNSTLDFRDDSLPRPFHAKIGQFGGTIAGLSTRTDKPAKVDLKGSVDGYAPVTLTGTASPLAPKPSIDLALDFANLDLATLTPYSGTYAGYTIARGQLSVQLAYTLENDRIKGKNHIVVQQLRLGDRVRSPKAIDLPLRLAIALLTDEHGVMDLGVDISGDLDDPKFDLGNIIWQAFRNVIVKAVTAPFRLLSGLVQGGPSDEDLGDITFAPGSDEMPESAKDKLTHLKTALEKRPALRVNIIGHVDPKADTEGLKQRALDYQLRNAGVDPEDIRKQNKRWRKKIEDLYEDKFPDQKIGDQSTQQLAQALRDQIELKPDQLSALAGQRALAVKRVLAVELGLPVERVFISSEGDEQAKSTQPSVTMQLDG